MVRNLCRAGQRPNYPETIEILVPVFRKLHSQGITEEDEDKLLFLREVILKLHRAKTRYSKILRVKTYIFEVWLALERDTVVDY